MPIVAKRPQGQRVQLHRALAKLGWGSRTQAWDWIKDGQVRVDGQVVTDPLTWVDLGRQRITRQGVEAKGPVPLTIALHKPPGIVVTRSDERGRKTVYDLLPAGLPWLFPAGRLDADSEGLLILTNDAQLALRLTDPVHHVPKTYHVTVKGHPNESALNQLRQGMTLSDGLTRPAHVKILHKGEDWTQLEIVLTEGRNRQIRRMGAAVGHKVRRLIRVAIARFSLGDLQPGQVREMNENEVSQLLGLARSTKKPRKLT
jgi:23S rRNA pseudouridine2605 synthase